MAQELNGVWRTVGGRRIFIAEGQSLSEAMKKSGKFNRKEKIKEGPYRAGDGSWVIDLQEGYTTSYGTDYIQCKTKRDCLWELEHEVTKDPEDSLASHKKKLEKLSNEEDGTYDLSTGKTKEYSEGYQVTFSTIGMQYDDDEYSKLVEKFKMHDHGTVDAGKFGGSPEISFNVDNIRTATKLGLKYNQISIWDWKNSKEIKTKGSGKWEREEKSNG